MYPPHMGCGMYVLVYKGYIRLYVRCSGAARSIGRASAMGAVGMGHGLSIEL